ncbi:MAG: M55 family metallopeptidase [Parvularculaceae bacterium]
MIKRMLSFTALWALAAMGAQAQTGPKIYISVDMEGVAGVVSPEQLGPSGHEYARFREFMTGEAIAAIEGAREAGAGEIVVSDSHGNMLNLLVERMPEGVRVIRGRPRPLSMMQGIEEGGFDGVMFIGYHASASNTEGVRAHTMSSARLSEVLMNGVPTSEGYINAAVAGQYGAPVILVSGDDAAVEEVAARVGDPERAVVKRNIGFHAAEIMTPQAAQALIRERARAAVGRIEDFEPMRLRGRIDLDITFHFYRPAELLAWLPSVERLGARSVRYRAENPADALTFLSFATGYTVALEP